MHDINSSLGASAPACGSPAARKPSSVFENIVASLTCLAIASVAFPFAFWLLKKSWEIPFPWGAALLPFMTILCAVGMAATASIVGVWRDPEGPREGAESVRANTKDHSPSGEVG